MINKKQRVLETNRAWKKRNVEKVQGYQKVFIKKRLEMSGFTPSDKVCGLRGCSGKFYQFASFKKYCSNKCLRTYWRKRNGYVNKRICACGVPLTGRHGKVISCSVKCSNIRKKVQRGLLTPKLRTTQIKCSRFSCPTLFYRKNNAQRFCSQKCQYLTNCISRHLREMGLQTTRLERRIGIHLEIKIEVIEAKRALITNFLSYKEYKEEMECISKEFNYNLKELLHYAKTTKLKPIPLEDRTRGTGKVPLRVHRRRHDEALPEGITQSHLEPLSYI